MAEDTYEAILAGVPSPRLRGVVRRLAPLVAHLRDSGRPEAPLVYRWMVDAQNEAERQDALVAEALAEPAGEFVDEHDLPAYLERVRAELREAARQGAEDRDVFREITADLDDPESP